MKKRIFLGGAALLFAAVTAFNMNMLQSNKTGDVSLEAIPVMAQAQTESTPTFDCPGGSNECVRVISTGGTYTIYYKQ